MTRSLTTFTNVQTYLLTSVYKNFQIKATRCWKADTDSG